MQLYFYEDDILVNSYEKYRLFYEYKKLYIVYMYTLVLAEVSSANTSAIANNCTRHSRKQIQSAIIRFLL